MLMRRVLFMLMCFASASLAEAQTVPVIQVPVDSGTGTSVQTFMFCSCARHSGNAIVTDPMQQLQNGRRLGVAGVKVLDEMPKGGVIISELTLESPASADSSENYGYKRFYALLQLKAQAAQHGANAIVDFKQALSSEGSRIIFSAKAAKVEP
ncbi:MAG: hypothetical protein ACK41G_04360 [Candidatus Thermochlorobacter sp.]